MPVKRGFYFMGFYPIPAFGVPVTEIVVAAIVDKFQVFGIGYQVGTDLKFV